MSAIDATKDGTSPQYVSHTGPMEQVSGHNFTPADAVRIPPEVLADRSISASARIYLWLLAHGASTGRAVKVSQAALMRDLRAARSTIQAALRYLARVGYIIIEHNPLEGRVFSYRLAGIGGALNGR